MYLVAHYQINIAVYAASGVPAAVFLRRVICDHLKFIIFPRLKKIVQNHGETGITSRMSSHIITIDINSCILVHALKFHHYRFLCPFPGRSKIFYISVASSGIESRLMAIFCIRCPFLMNHGIMGQCHYFPAAPASGYGCHHGIFPRF